MTTTPSLLLLHPLACNLAGEDADLTLPHITVHCHSQRCLSCGMTHRWSKVYETLTQGKTKKYLPVQTPSQIPVDYFVVAVEIPEEPTCACHECIGSRPQPDADVARRWNETLKRKAAEAAAGRGNEGAQERAQERPKAPTLDML